MATSKAEECAHPVCSCVTARRASAAAPSARLWKRRRTSIVRADTSAGAKRPSKECVQQLVNPRSEKG